MIEPNHSAQLPDFEYYAELLYTINTTGKPVFATFTLLILNILSERIKTARFVRESGVRKHDYVF